MDDAFLQVMDYEGEGYQPLVRYCGWRVALMRNADRLEPERLRQLERHLETDEVFVLLGGCVDLVLRVGVGDQPEALEVVTMQTQKVYNIRQGVWHTTVMSADACLLIIENSDTDADNSEIQVLSDAQCALVSAVRDNL